MLFVIGRIDLRRGETPSGETITIHQEMANYFVRESNHRLPLVNLIKLLLV